MANPKSSGAGDELSPEQQKFAESSSSRPQAMLQAAATFAAISGQYLKSGRQQKEEVKAVKKAEPRRDRLSPAGSFLTTPGERLWALF